LFIRDREKNSEYRIQNIEYRIPEYRMYIIEKEIPWNLLKPLKI